MNSEKCIKLILYQKTIMDKIKLLIIFDLREGAGNTGGKKRIKQDCY